MGAAPRAFCCKVVHIYILATIGLTGEPIGTPFILFIGLALKRKVHVFLRQKSNSRVMSSTGSIVLSLRVGSFSNRSLMTFRAGSTWTEVNRADTSYKLRHSPGAKLMCLTCSTKSRVLLMCYGDLPTKGLRILVKFFSHTIGD